jgi:hypothetical protein
MGSLKNQGKGPDVVGALRDWVGQDHRIGNTESNGHRGDTSSSPEEASEQLESGQPPQDLLDADPEIASGGVHQSPYDFHIAPSLQGPYDPDPQHANDYKGADPAPADERPHRGQRAATPHSRWRAAEVSPQAPGAIRPSLTKRVAATLAQGFVAIVVIGTVVAFLSNSSIRLTGNSIQSSPPETLPVQSQTVQLDSVLQQELALREQLESVANNLASMRQTLERVSARQDEMEQNIATLRAAEQNLRQEVTAIGQAVPNPGTHSRRHRRGVEKLFQSTPLTATRDRPM